jgi:hypothetical protein
MRLLVFVRAHTKVLNCFPSVPLPAEKYSVGTSWRTKGELVKSKRFTSRLQDALPSALGKAESGNRELGDLEQANVICDCANLNDDF